jgi:hypothetical protein
VIAGLRPEPSKTVREILSDLAVHVIPQSQESFVAGFDFYAGRPDKRYSLTDCISMETCVGKG